MYVGNKLTYFVVILTFLAGIFYINLQKTSNAGVKIEKIDGMIDWGKASNYVEAKQVMQMAKEINKEKRRRKQLRDAGLSESEIKEIIYKEKLAQANNNKVVDVKKKRTMLQDKNDDEDIENYSDNSAELSSNDENDIQQNNDNSLSNDGDYEIELNNQKLKGNNNKINNYYTYPSKAQQNKNDKKKLHQEELEAKKIIDHNLNIVPNVPENRQLIIDTSDSQDAIMEYNKNNKRNSNNYYDNFELSRMLTKAGENINNPTNFAIFTKEIAKIANKPNKKQQLEAPAIEEYIDDDEEYSDNDLAFSNRRIGAFATANKNKKVKRMKNYNIYHKNLKNMYAMADNQENVILHKNQNNTNNKKVSYAYNEGQMKRFYANKNNEGEEELLYDNSDIGKNSLTEGQITAKNMGAPYPYKRDTVNYNTQYQPQNIAQIAYDQNNTHLKPAVFESHIIKQVFDNLGRDDAIQLARALINKVGYVDITDEDGNTLLMHAVARKNQSLIAMLLAEGASPNAMNNDGFSPLHLAASNGDNSAIYNLMMSGGKPNVRDNNGNTALMYASKMCDANSVKLMLSLGGDPNIENRSTGRTSFDFASENDNPAIINLLIKENQRTFKGKKPVDLLSY